MENNFFLLHMTSTAVQYRAPLRCYAANLDQEVCKHPKSKREKIRRIFQWHFILLFWDRQKGKRSQIAAVRHVDDHDEKANKREGVRRCAVVCCICPNSG